LLSKFNLYRYSAAKIHMIMDSSASARYKKSTNTTSAYNNNNYSVGLYKSNLVYP
jgi:hypothetical protein